ncbi:MAG: hypothetical protein FGM33_04105 [Candidatus Kapabacteria bacterium]|nr:hypothetical protein [Candidatus Kapabacteria bacterium]
MPPAARIGDMIISTATSGAPTPLVPPGTPTVMIGSMPAATVGDTCGVDTVMMGSTTVLIGGKPAARVGDPSASGGSIIPPGCLTVLIGG